MMYILDQRLRAQNIQQDKARKGMVNKSFYFRIFFCCYSLTVTAVRKSRCADGQFFGCLFVYT